MATLNEHSTDRRLHGTRMSVLLWSGLLLWPSGADSDSWEQVLRQAKDAGDQDRAVLALDSGAEGRGEDLAFALRAGWISMVESLLDQGVDIDWPVGGSDPPLVLAIKNGDIRMVWVLLERGAAMDSRDDRAVSPLETAIGLGEVGLALMLIDRGADITHKDHHALRLAASHGQAAVARRLLARGGDANARSLMRDPGSRGLSPLMAAARAGQLDLVRLLLEHGGDPTARSAAGLSAYDYARTGLRDRPQLSDYQQIVRLLSP